MKTYLGVLTAIAVLPALAVPVVDQDDVTLAQGARSRLVVSYTLRNEPAIITADIQTNDAAGGAWVSIGAQNFTHMTGDVNRIVRETDVRHSFTWDARTDWPNHRVEGAGLRVVVKAWSLSAPPDYMMTDLVVTNLVRFYSCAEAVPGGVQDASYKTTRMLFRRIPAAGVEWRMGAPSAESGTGSEISAGTTIKFTQMEIPHYVRLSADYYLAVFPVTQSQCKLLIGTYRNGSSSGILESDVDFVLRPANKLGYDGQVRGASEVPASGTIVERMRSITGLVTVDVPTDAQWEYACRAGTGTAYWCGDTLLANARSSHLEPVGKADPNPWGLYDMIGNVAEWCRDIWLWGDYYVATFGEGWTSDKTVEDPKVLTDAWGNGYRVMRGWKENAKDFDLRSARRWRFGPTGAQDTGHFGCRLACGVVFE